MRNPRSRIGLVVSVMAAALLWLPLPASAVYTWINIEIYVSGDPDLSSLDPITIAQVGIQNCDPTMAGSCMADYGEANAPGVEFIVRNTAYNLPAGLGDDAFLGGLYFASPTGLDAADFFVAVGTTEIDGFDVSGGNNAGYPYSWSVDFAEAPPDDRVLPGDIVKWFIEGEDVSNFLVEGSAKGNGNKPPFLVMAHLQQVGPDSGGTCSLKYIGNSNTIVTDPNSQNSSSADVSDAELCASVPEPSSVALLGIGVLLLAGTAAWRQRKTLTRIR